MQIETVIVKRPAPQPDPAPARDARVAAPGDERLLASIAAAWTCLALILLGMNSAFLIKAAVRNDFASFATDPGEGSVGFLIATLAIYGIMPLLVRLLRARWFRWAGVALAAFYTLAFLGHEAEHLMVGDVPFGLIHSLDLAHHFAGLALVYLSFRWARRPASPSPTEESLP